MKKFRSFCSVIILTVLLATGIGYTDLSVQSEFLLPDLVPFHSAVTYPGSGGEGTIDFGFGVLNQGQAGSPSGTGNRERIYYSQDPDDLSSATLVLEAGLTTGYAPGQSFSGSLANFSGPSLPSYVVFIVDQQNTITESDETNNSESFSIPLVDAGLDQYYAGLVSKITLDGSESVDLDNDIKTYHWEQISGATADIEDPDSATTQVALPSFPVKDPGPFELTFQLTITDAEGFVLTDSVTIRVNQE